MSGDHDDDINMSARPLVPDPFGKCSGNIEFRAPELLIEAAITLGSVEQPYPQNKSVWARGALERAAFGLLQTAMAQLRRPPTPPNDPTGPELDNALVTLALMHGMSRESFEREVLAKAVFGELSMLRKVVADRPGINQSNAG